MARQKRYQGTELYIVTHWPRFTIQYASMIGGLLLIGAGLVTDWYALIPLALVLILVGAYLTFSQMWAIHKIYDPGGLNPADILYSLSQPDQEAKIVCIDLGRRDTALRIAENLTTGKVTVVDVYNPESNANPALRRLRNRSTHPIFDPRLVWVDGTVSLLPLPDNSVSAVFLDRILGEIDLESDRSRLLSEAYRVLEAEGRILIAEPVRTQTNILSGGPSALSLPSAEVWRQAISESGFEIQEEQDLQGLLFILAAEKPSETSGQQLALKLEFV